MTATASKSVEAAYSDISRWLENEFKQRNLDVRIYQDRITPETNWLLVVPVFIKGILNNNMANEDELKYTLNEDKTVYLEGSLDITDRASALQEVEDAWNNQSPEPEIQVVLRPVAN